MLNFLRRSRRTQVAVGIAVVVILLGGILFATMGRSTPAPGQQTGQTQTKNTFQCDGQTMTLEQIANYLHFDMQMADRLQVYRGLSPEEMCKLSKPKLQRAISKVSLTKPAYDNPYEAMQWELSRQIDSKGEIAPNAFQKAADQLKGMSPAKAGGPMPNAAGIGPNAWNSIGPGNIGGRIRALVGHPTDINTYFVGSVAGGVWKTSNSGQSWQPLADFLPNTAVGALVIDPVNPNILYAGTGEAGYFRENVRSTLVGGMRGNGIYKTIDGGQSWQQLASTNSADFYYVGRLAISPNGQTLLAATKAGIFRSTNGGVNWTKTQDITPQNDVLAAFLDVDFHPTDNTKAVAAGYYGFAAFTEDGGATWTVVNNTSAAWNRTKFLNRVELSYAPSSPNIVYASVYNTLANNTERGQIWKSTDGGKNYTQVASSTNALGTQGDYDNTVAIDPTDPNKLLWGGLDQYRSADGGATWTKISAWFLSPVSAHADHHYILYNKQFNGTTNKQVFFANDGGIYRVDDIYAVTQTEGWIPLNNGLRITQFYSLAGNADSGTIVGGTQDNGSLVYKGNPEGWAEFFGGDGAYSAADPTDPNFFYGAYVFAQIARSNDGGNSASYIYNGIGDAGANANFIAPFMLDPNDPKKMWVAGNTLWLSSDVKAIEPTWVNITVPVETTTGQTCNQTLPRSCLSAITIAKGNSDNMWVGRSGGHLYHTTNGTSPTPTWTPIHNNLPGGLPGRAINKIVLDPFNSSIVYVAIGGWTGNNLFKSTDNGATWADITGTGLNGLPDVPIYAMTTHPHNSNWLYVGTTIGIFASEDNGVTWQVAPNDGPANVPIAEFIWLDNTLYVATHGRGIFRALVPSPVATLKSAGVQVTELVGNGNGVAEPGESVVIKLGLKNTSTATAQGINGTLTVLNSTATLGVATSSYPDIATSTTLSNTKDYVLTVNSNLGCGSAIALRQTVNYGGGRVLTYDFTIPTGKVSNATPTVYPYTGGAVFIPDNGNPGVVAPITINTGNPAARVGTVASLKIISVTHTYIGDVSFKLVSPSGKFITVVGNRGGDGTGMSNLILKDSAANPISAAPNSVVISGTYRPEQPLSSMANEPLDGDWKLHMIDGGPGDTGTLAANGWELEISGFSCDPFTNPAPAITNIAPNSAVVGGPSLVLTVNGTNFVGNSVVNWNGSARQTSFISATRLAIQVPAADISASATVSITVTNPTPGGGTSNQVPFTVGPFVCDPLVVTKAEDDNSCGTLRYALTTAIANSNNAATSTIIIQADSPIMVSSPLPALIAGMTISGVNCTNGPSTTIVGSGINGDGLTFSGSGNVTLTNLRVTGFNGRQINVATGNIHLLTKCVVARRNAS